MGHIEREWIHGRHGEVGVAERWVHDEEDLAEVPTSGIPISSVMVACTNVAVCGDSEGMNQPIKVAKGCLLIGLVTLMDGTSFVEQSYNSPVNGTATWDGHGWTVVST